MSFSFRDFFRQHPAIVKAAEGLADAGIEAAEEVVLQIVGQKFGILTHLFPLETLVDKAGDFAEAKVNAELESVIAPDPANGSEVVPEPAPAAEQPAPAQPPRDNSRAAGAARMAAVRAKKGESATGSLDDATKNQAQAAG